VLPPSVSTTAPSHGRLLDGWLVDEPTPTTSPGGRRRHRLPGRPLLMTDLEATAAMAAAAVELVT
jgi:hypothetical protein